MVKTPEEVEVPEPPADRTSTVVSFLPQDHPRRHDAMCAVLSVGAHWEEAPSRQQPNGRFKRVVEALESARFSLHESTTKRECLQCVAIAATVRLHSSGGDHPHEVILVSRDHTTVAHQLVIPDLEVPESGTTAALVRHLSAALGRAAADRDRAFALAQRIPSGSSPTTALRVLHRRPEWRNSEGTYDVFACFKREDVGLVKECVRAMRAAGVSVWWDDDLWRASGWSAQIDKALPSCRLVVFFDPGSAFGNTQRRELQAVQQARKPMLRVCVRGREMHDEVFPDSVPHELPPAETRTPQDLADLAQRVLSEALACWTWRWKIDRNS